MASESVKKNSVSISEEDISEPKPKKPKKLVRLNKWKIIIIVTVLVLVLAGIIVGIYFAVRPKDFIPNNVQMVSVDEVNNIVEDYSDTDDVVGVVFYAEDSLQKDLAFYGSTAETDVLEGPFSKYTDNFLIDSEHWYVVKTENTEELNNAIYDLFYVDGSGSEYEEPIPRYSSFYYLGEVDDSIYTYGSESGSNNISATYYDVGYTTVDSEGNTTNEWILEPIPVASTDDSAELLETNNSDGVYWMWFYHGELVFVASGIANTATETTEEITLAYSDELYIQFLIDVRDFILNEEEILIEP